MTTWIETHTGRRFDIMEPAAHMIDVRDIAWALTNINRFNGHTTRPWSVARHTELVADIAVTLCADMGVDEAQMPMVAAHAYLHDAHEAYIGDIVSPLKTAMRKRGMPLWPIVDPIDQAIRDHFGLPKPAGEILAMVHDADLIALAVEKRDLLSDLPWEQKLPAAPDRFTIADYPPRNHLRFADAMSSAIVAAGGRRPDIARMVSAQ